MILNFGSFNGSGGSTLEITAEPNSTVTITKGDLSYTTIADNNSSAIFKGVEDGIWTITTTTSSGSSSTKAIEVKAYWVAEGNIKFLYKEGVMCPEFESGFTGVGKITNSGNRLTFQSQYNNSYGNYNSAYYSKTKIDFTGYNYLYVEIDSNTGTCYLGFDSDSSMSGTAISSCMKITSSDVDSSKIFRLPLSSISSKTQAFAFGTNPSASTKYVIKNLWLTKSTVWGGTEKSKTSVSFTAG